MLRWDARNEDKGKHGKFENMWKGYMVSISSFSLLFSEV